MQEKQPYSAEHTELIDTSIIAKYPPNFLQKALFVKEPTKMQHIGNRIYLRRANGRIITWCKLEQKSSP